MNAQAAAGRSAEHAIAHNDERLEQRERPPSGRVR